MSKSPMSKWLVAAAALLAPGTALAQARECVIPRALPEWKAEGPTQREPRRAIPTASYTLALSWSPGYCRTNYDDADARFQCAGDNRFGWVLHGLWPDGAGKQWPQYCRTAPKLSADVIRRNLCVTPSAQLIQHEWVKHGTCMTTSPAAYFSRARTLFQAVRFPNMDQLSRRRRLTAGQLAAAIARVNPGMTADMMRVTADRQGWLSEVWMCRDLKFRPMRCPAHQGGLSPSAQIKIWRGRG
jgi:ribonuclease T2